MAVCLEDVEAAHARIAQYIRQTPVLACGALDRRAGACLYLKAESLQVTGSFKIRGATNAILQLSEDQLRDGVVTHSSGNHGAALAHAAQAVGAEATIIMPTNAPKCKVQAARGAGGNVLQCEPTIEARTAAAQSHMEANPKCTFIPPYNHPHIVAGQGTIGIELLQQMAANQVLQLGSLCTSRALDNTTGEASNANSLDAVIVPVSGGGLISGIATVVKAKLPNCKVIAAEPRGRNDMADAAACMEAGKLVKLPAPPDTIADGLRGCSGVIHGQEWLTLRDLFILKACPAQLGDVTWPIIQRHVDGVITVSDADIVGAMRALFEDTKVAVEPSGAASLAAALSPDLQRLAPGAQNVAVVLSGGNVDYDRVGFWESWAEQA